VYGPSTGEGGQINIYASSGWQNNSDYFAIDSFQDNLRIYNASTGGIRLNIHETNYIVSGSAFQVNGRLFLQDTSGIGTSNTICRTSEATSGFDGAGSVAGLGDCSSLSRYKDNQTDMSFGLAEIRQLRAREFDWNTQNGMHDFGFVAEEVEAINPIFAT